MQSLAQKIALRETFAFETTLSGRSYIPQIKEWQSDGWLVVLIYLYIPSAEFSANRVAQRVEQGGHDIPAVDIVRRYPRSMKNLFLYADICDRTFCLDNETGEISSIFEAVKGGGIEIIDEKTYSEIVEFCKNVR